MPVFHRRAVIAQHAHPIGQIVIARRDRAGITESAEVLSRIKTRGCGMPQASGPAAFVARALGLRIVLQHFQPVLLRQRHDRIHVRGLPVKVHRDDGLGPRRDRRFDPLRIDVAGGFVRFDRHRPRPDIRHGEPRRDESVGRNDHLVSRADVPRPQHKLQGIEPVAHRNAMLGLAVGCEFRFESPGLLAKQNPPRIHHPVVSRIEPVLQLKITGMNIKKWNFHCLMADD